MTKKDFELIAKALLSCKPAQTNPYPDAFKGWHNTVTCLAAALATTNPRFDRARFLAACGVQS